MSPNTRAEQRGFTLIELLVTVGILCVLIGLGLPAAQAARESARRSACQANLRQIGIALHAYHAQYECFPITDSCPDLYRFPHLTWRHQYYSLFCRLLPHLEQPVLFSSINFSLQTAPLDLPLGAPPVIEGGDQNAMNSTAFTTRMAVLLCPSDGVELGGAGTNYRGNAGLGALFAPTLESPDSGNGFFVDLADSRVPLIRAASIGDGLSHTAAFSERNRGSGIKGRMVRDRDALPLYGISYTADDVLVNCRISSLDPNPRQSPFVLSGRWWFWSGRAWVIYTHAQQPNGPVPDCTIMNHLTSPGMWTSRSLHPRGVNTLFGDGSVRFISSSVDLQTWRAVGTRNGGEPLDW